MLHCMRNFTPPPALIVVLMCVCVIRLFFCGYVVGFLLVLVFLPCRYVVTLRVQCYGVLPCVVHRVVVHCDIVFSCSVVVFVFDWCGLFVCNRGAPSGRNYLSRTIPAIQGLSDLLLRAITLSYNAINIQLCHTIACGRKPLHVIFKITACT